MVFYIEWKEGPAKGYVDALAPGIFSADGKSKGVWHHIFARDGGAKNLKAKFDCVVNGRTAELDYEPYKAENVGVLLGRMRLEFKTASRREIVSVSWSDEELSEFTAVDVVLSKDNSANYVPWELRPEGFILRKDLHKKFGGSSQGGISQSSQTPNIFLFTDPKVGELHGYVDGWKDDGLYHYTGEGQRGDQRFISGNAAILNHIQEGRSLRLFEGVGGKVLYQGKLGLDLSKPYYMADAPETGGGPLRQVIVFRLKPIDVNQPNRPGHAAAVSSNDKIDLVPLEENQSERFVVDPDREPYEAEKREAKLVAQFCSWLDEAPKRYRITPKGEAQPIFCDLYITSQKLLIEAKGTVSRNAIRMAIGQLMDYGRFIPDVERRAVLLPSKPRADLLELLAHAYVDVFYRNETGFERIEALRATPQLQESFVEEQVG